ncbi:Protein involved in cell division [Campylobacter hyointestinalis]|uniref:protein adenylyltransferase n=2 Tax=Campylobacter fetus TaxID=196 RepID=A0A825B8P0_CAMFE|nr:MULTISPECIES: Fic family protein [Campylobacter]CBH51829.1 filamentation induced by cAMP protein [Campylobacter fetus subsp. fetus]EAI8859293.1 cell filamentation protein Fic [Campylobacter fetus]EGK8193103.1 cell filamentation protein Fic [Campylobacter fetus]QMS68033.1 Fic family protein [Campylobacter fetus]CUU92158.1 Protein involved in cell division [Campylobacter hyointestinalis]
MQEQYTEIKDSNIINKQNIDIAVGLGLVDDLKPSEYFYKAVEKSRTYNELEDNVKKYYDGKKLDKKEVGEKECDIVSVNIAKYLEKSGFTLSPVTLKTIHKNLFWDAFPQGLEKYVGVFRDVNISKKEEVLGGEKSVEYGNYDELGDMLDYDFDREKRKDYTKMTRQEQALNVGKFVSGIWQIHPFREGNTRTIAVFTIKYLQSKGFEANNDIFKENSKYFRDALVLANYDNMKENIKSDFSYLESFFNKFILNKNIELKLLPNSPKDYKSEKSVLSRLGAVYDKKVQSGAIKQPQISEKSKEKER